MVKMQRMGLQETEQLVEAIWEVRCCPLHPLDVKTYLLMETNAYVVCLLLQAKQIVDQTHLRQHPLSFLYEYFSRVITGAVPEHEAVARKAYSLYHACSQHSASSASVQLFAAVLTGHISEAAWADRQAMMSGLMQVLASLPPMEVQEGGTAATGKLCWTPCPPDSF